MNTPQAHGYGSEEMMCQWEKIDRPETCKAQHREGIIEREKKKKIKQVKLCLAPILNTMCCVLFKKKIKYIKLKDDNLT
jgi:hypothetical protein